MSDIIAHLSWNTVFGEWDEVCKEGLKTLCYIQNSVHETDCLQFGFQIKLLMQHRLDILIFNESLK